MTAWLINFIAFQLGWFGCVWGAANGLPWLGVAITTAVVAVHLWQARSPVTELKLLGLTALIGVTLDSLLVVAGLLRFPSGTFIEGLAPYWIVAMWVLFATTFNVALRWLKGRWLSAALLGLMGGPLAYFAGSRLGAVSFHEQALISLTALAVVWGAAMPALMALSNRFDGMAETNPKTDLPSASATAEKPA